MKIEEILESGMVADYIAYRDLLIDELNDAIEFADLSIDKFVKDDKRVTNDMYKWFEDKHSELEHKFEYDARTDSMGRGSEQDFSDARFDLARKVMATIVGEEV